jgi:hypothetical protein
MVRLITYTYKIPLSPTLLFAEQRRLMESVPLDITPLQMPIEPAPGPNDVTTLFPPIAPTEVHRTLTYVPVQPAFDQNVGTGNPAAILRGLWKQKLAANLSAAFEVTEDLVIA